MDVVDEVCKAFEDYAQATYKASGKPTIIRQVRLVTFRFDNTKYARLSSLINSFFINYEQLGSGFAFFSKGLIHICLFSKGRKSHVCYSLDKMT